MNRHQFPLCSLKANLYHFYQLLIVKEDSAVFLGILCRQLSLCIVVAVYTFFTIISEHYKHLDIEYLLLLLVQNIYAFRQILKKISTIFAVVTFSHCTQAWPK